MTLLRRFRALYGAGPLHLLALLASFAVAGAAVVGWFQRPNDVRSVLEWFVAAILIHDLVLLPLYSLLDRIAFGGLQKRVDPDQVTTSRGHVNPAPYLRIPAILSGLLLAVFFPVIFGFGAGAELSASGIAESGYLARWLFATGVMFALSGVAYAMALSHAGAPPRPVAPDREQTPSGNDALPDPDRSTSGNDTPRQQDQSTPDGHEHPDAHHATSDDDGFPKPDQTLPHDDPPGPPRD